MKGRKPTSTRSKVLAGNPGHRPLNRKEPRHGAPAETFDEPPLELASNRAARAEWKRLAPQLRKTGHIVAVDRGALVALCLEWSRYLEATKRVKRMGMVVRTKSGYSMINPYLSIATKALASCSKLWPELGLTPSSRSRVKIAEPLEPTDPFAEFDKVDSAHAH